MSVPHTGQLYPPGNIYGTHFSQGLIGPQDHSAAGRNKSTKNSNDTIGKRNRNFPPRSAVPQPTESLSAPTAHQQYQQMLISTLKLVYVHNGLLHVSGNQMAIFREVRYKRLDNLCILPCRLCGRKTLY